MIDAKSDHGVFAEDAVGQKLDRSVFGEDLDAFGEDRVVFPEGVIVFAKDGRVFAKEGGVFAKEGVVFGEDAGVFGEDAAVSDRGIDTSTGDDHPWSGVRDVTGNPPHGT